MGGTLTFFLRSKKLRNPNMFQDGHKAFLPSRAASFPNPNFQFSSQSQSLHSSSQRILPHSEKTPEPIYSLRPSSSCSRPKIQVDTTENLEININKNKKSPAS